MSTVFCSHCGKPHYKRPRDIAKSLSGKLFCSTECWGKSLEISKLCIICGNEILKNKSVRKTCSRKCSNINRKGTRYKIGQPKSKYSTKEAQKSRLIEERGSCCERCGFDQVKILIVHHKVERANGGSDEPSNLELLCPNCHAIHHYG